MKRFAFFLLLLLAALLIVSCGANHTKETTQEQTSALTTPEATIPASTTPAVTTPAVTTPAVTTPAVTTPAVTTPAVTTPAVTTPAVTTPAVTTPAVTTPAVTTPAVTTAAVTTPGTTAVPTVTFGDENTPIRLVTTTELYNDDAFLDEVSALCDVFEEAGMRRPRLFTDKIAANGREIVIGNTNRECTAPVLNKYEWDIVVEGETIFLRSFDDLLLGDALAYFAKTYVAPAEGKIVMPATFRYLGELDMFTSNKHSLTYAEMAMTSWEAFNKEYSNGYYLEYNWFWDLAEMLEIYVDAYEATKDEGIKDQMIKLARFFPKLQRGENWEWNEYNDDIMWACIAFARISLLTGESSYYDIAKENFDLVWKRAYDDTLGGGLYWRIENTTKNSCVNCPGAIAACLLGELSGDESYYEKAKGLIQWELDYMFEKDTGRVYDAYEVSGKKNKWASTYNQGTFIGACTYLYKHYKDEAYLGYAQKAAEYAMTKLVSGEGTLDNGENHGNDLPGFKGILTRWLYRYAKEVDDLTILSFLQHNADVAYANRNENGLIWTNWHQPTPENPKEAGHITFSMSTAVALMFNCQPWW